MILLAMNGNLISSLIKILINLASLHISGYTLIVIAPRGHLRIALSDV